MHWKHDQCWSCSQSHFVAVGQNRCQTSRFLMPQLHQDKIVTKNLTKNFEVSLPTTFLSFFHLHNTKRAKKHLHVSSTHLNQCDGIWSPSFISCRRHNRATGNMEDMGNSGGPENSTSFFRAAGTDNVLDSNVATVPDLDPLIFVPCTGRSKCWRHFAFR